MQDRSVASQDPIERSLGVMVLAGFASMYSMRFCDAMLPEFGRMFSLSAGQTAQALSWYVGGYGLMQLVSGALAERLGKVLTIRVCLVGCAGGAMISGLAFNFEMLLLGRLITGFFSGGIIPMIIAWLGDHVSTDQRQSRLATLMSATVMGTMAGQWSGGLIVSWLGWRTAFFSLSILFLLVVWRMATLSAADNSDTFSDKSLLGQTRAHVGRVRSVFRAPASRWVLLIGLVEGLLIYATIAFLPTHLHHSLGVSLSVAGTVLAFYSLGGFLYARSAKELLSRFPVTSLIGVGTFMQVLGFVGLAWSPWWQLDVALCLLTGFGLLMVHNSIQLQATEIAGQRGVGVSMFVMMIFLGQTLNAWLGGLVVDTWSTSLVFLVAALGSCLVSWMLYTHLRKAQV